jgi:hypothetical protein
VASLSTTTITGSRRVRDLVIAGLALAAALFVLYAVFLDQGGLLAPMLGATSFDGNYLHEFAHDGRHLFAVPCH